MEEFADLRVARIHDECLGDRIGTGPVVFAERSVRFPEDEFLAVGIGACVDCQSVGKVEQGTGASRVVSDSALEEVVPSRRT